ncbi:rRNA maturation RNase YbeY [Candidatus Parcubacteria bacterium]|nr:rRNA maturation RNase YbeY [Candidatus Parcubacteria bacterium]
MNSRNLARKDDKIEDFSIQNLTKAKGTPEGAPFKATKRKVLGDSYRLSLVLCGDALSRRLNRAYRKKDKPTNVLAFPLSKDSGEIFINLKKVKPFSVEFLFIHGLLHLKGMEHGATMERREQELLKKFYGPPHRSRNRHRNVPSKGGHR